MGLRSVLPRGRGLVLLDVVVALWVAVWILLGVQVAQEVRDIGRISTTVARVGSAVAETGRQLEQLGGLPLVGDEIGDTGRPIREAGERAGETAAASGESAQDLATLLGVSIALVPSLPLLLMYVPQRVAMYRDRRAVATALLDGQGDDLQETLARRAAVHIPFHVLQQVTPEPQRELAEGRFAPLAVAELQRLGLEAPRRWQGSPRARR